MEQLKPIQELMVAVWAYLKKYYPSEPLNEEQRETAFRAICSLMNKYQIAEKTPVADFGYTIMVAAYDLIDAVGGKEGKKKSNRQALR